MEIFSRFSVPESAGLVCGVGRTQQHFKDECDINNIIKGYVPVPAPSTAVYGDFSCTDLQEAYGIVEQASVAFSEVPSDIRARFNHDPVEFYEFVQNPANQAELAQLGLLEKSAVTPSAAEGTVIVNPTDAPAPAPAPSAVTDPAPAPAPNA